MNITHSIRNRFVVTTSDRYVHLMPKFAFYFNKCIGQQTSVDVLGFNAPQEELPPNFHFFSMGEQRYYGGWWTTPYKRYFDLVPDNECVTLFLEDYMLRRFCYIDFINALDIMKEPLSVKFDLTKDVATRPHHRIGDDLVVAGQDTKYRTSLQAAIWKSQYLKRFLCYDWNPWEFELIGSKLAQNDNMNIYGTYSGIVDYSNAMLKGAPCKEN